MRSVFGAARNIKMHLEMGDEYEDATLVSFSGEMVDFGMNLSPFGKGVSQNPLTMTIANDVPNGRHIKLKVVATCDGLSTPLEYPFTITVNNMVKLSGMITADRTLTADHEYLVSDNVAIPEGVTLTIEPGTVLRFNSNTGISNSGTLIADGTPEQPIIMLSLIHI